jgi:hypothetical protein
VSQARQFASEALPSPKKHQKTVMADAGYARQNMHSFGQDPFRVLPYGKSKRNKPV